MQVCIALYYILCIIIIQECSSLAGKLIQGQVSRAQEAEEMFILKKELAKTRRKLAELEERQSRKESTESNESLHEESPKIVNGGGRGDDGGEDREEGEGFVLDCGPEIMVLEDEEAAERLHVVTPDHVTREEAQVGDGRRGRGKRERERKGRTNEIDTVSCIDPLHETGSKMQHRLLQACCATPYVLLH